MRRQASGNDNLVEINDLRMLYPIRKGLFGKKAGYVTAVDRVSFAVRRGETLGLVGESGCGKTTIGRLIMQAFPPTSGSIVFQDQEKGSVELSRLAPEELRVFRKKMQMVFQDPYSSLNPRMTVLEIVGEPLVCLQGLKPDAVGEKVSELLTVVGLDPRYANRYPHAFSGGQRQRIGIARAIALNPELIIADEAVSALDVSIQAQVINLFEDLQEAYSLTYLFISHDLSVVEHISDRVGVMYLGKLVELAQTDKLFSTPKHPYTEALLSAVPRANVHEKLNRVALKGEVADPSALPSGCAFHPRCPYAEPICAKEEPPLVDLDSSAGNSHAVACHFFNKLSLKGTFSNQQ